VNPRVKQQNVKRQSMLLPSSSAEWEDFVGSPKEPTLPGSEELVRRTRIVFIGAKISDRYASALVDALKNR
jgi:hypothetical protein